MHIHLDFDNYDEFLAFLTAAEKAGLSTETPAKPEKTPAKPEKNPEKAEKTTEKAEKTPAKAPETAPQEEAKPADPEPEKPAEPEKKVTMTDVRKVMTKLNKAMGRNVAKELIAKRGFAKLTEVKPEDLPGLLEEAEGMLNA
jgi:hypothetical protein